MDRIICVDMEEAENFIKDVVGSRVGGFGRSLKAGFGERRQVVGLADVWLWLARAVDCGRREFLSRWRMAG